MKKIAIIKLGALGDVIRTLPLAASLKKKFFPSKITWITKRNALEIIKTDKNIDEVFSTPFHTKEEFDILYNFDIEEEATELAVKLQAKEKKGFYSEEGYPAAFNLGAQYYINTIFDDELKKKNDKTYQEMMYEAADLPYSKEKYVINLTKNEIDFGKKFIEDNQLNNKKIIGIHMGSSPRWPSKTWSEKKIEEFISRVKKEKKYEIILFAGAEERERQVNLLKKLSDSNLKVFHNNPENTLREFAALVNVCEKMICSDSLALHVSIGLGKKTIGLFFCTSPSEVENYDVLNKIISPKLYEFFPERQDENSEELRNSISVEQVLKEID